jgi:putative ABC transport system ATP-binding protein
MLRIEHVLKAFGSDPARVVLADVCLDVAAGEYVAVMGESGSGKSTLLNLIAGLEVPDRGSVLIDHQDITRLDDASRTRLRRSSLGFVFQAFHLLPHLTVERNIGLPLALNGVHGPQARARIDELLVAVGLQAHRRSMPSSLSGGEMQRVAIARALVHRPQLVLADEPTGNLDTDSAQEVLALLRAQLRQDGSAGILVTHSHAASQTADKIYRLTHGRLALESCGQPS